MGPTGTSFIPAAWNHGGNGEEPLLAHLLQSCEEDERLLLFPPTLALLVPVGTGQGQSGCALTVFE